MIAEDVLERGLAAAAAQFPPPAEAVEQLRAELAATGPHPRRRRPRPTRAQWLIAVAAAAVLFVVIALAVGSHGGAGSGAPGAERSSGAFVTAAPEAATAGGGATADSTSAAAVGAPSSAGGETRQSRSLVPAPAGDSAKVVKTGQLELQVPKGRVVTTVDRLTALAAQERGYVADSSTSQGGGDPSGRVALRVPAASFDDALGHARALGKPLSEQTSGEDVTAKYVDLQARIHALQATRSTYLSILSKATTIGETLAVQQQVTDVQTQIERLQGELKVLNDSAAYATLDVTVDQPARPATVAHHASGFSRAVDRSVSRFVHGVEAIIGVIGPILLAFILVALGWLVARVAYRRLRRQLV